MHHTPLREYTASLWMVVNSTSNLYPTTGQGGSIGTRTSSAAFSASLQNPVILEAIAIEATTATGTVTISDGAASPAELFSVKVEHKQDASQWFPIGGPYGCRLNQNFCIKVSDTTHLPKVKLFYRFQP